MKQYKIINPETILELINRLEFFKDFTLYEKQKLAEIHQHFASYEKDDVIIKEGDHDTFFYILIIGDVSVTKGNPPLTITNLKPGDCFGEISFLTGSPRTANVIADTNTIVVLKMSRELVDELDINMREKVKDKLIKRLVERLNHMNRFVISIKNRLPESASLLNTPTYIP